MKKDSHIPFKLISRLAIFMLIVASAIIFDCYRDDSFTKIETEKVPVSASTNYFTYYVTPVKTYSFETESKLIPQRISPQAQNKYLKKLHNLKTYHTLKAESLDNYSPLVSFHYLQFRECIYSSPDDDFISIG